MNPYQAPLSQLLALGRPTDSQLESENWRDPASLGIGPEQIPELIRMMTDPELHAGTENEFFATVHAFRLLAKLGAKEAIAPFLELYDSDNDWITEEGPHFLALMGLDAIPLYAQLLGDEAQGTHPRWGIATALQILALRFPDRRGEIVAILQDRLGGEDSEVNGAIVSNLVRLKAAEAYPAIERVFQQGLVEEFLITLNDVRDGFGMEPLPEDPEKVKAKMALWREQFGPAMDVADLLQQFNTKSQERKVKKQVKAKRKQQKAARKKNRK